MSVALLVACAVAVLVAGVVAVPHMSDCAGTCAGSCRARPAGIERIVCESRCRAQCVFARSREDVARRRLRAPTKVKVGGAEIAAPELNFPVARLAKAAVQLRAPLAEPLRSKAAKVDLRPELARRGVEIENQLDTSACMAHALTSAMEYELVPVLRSDPAVARRVGAPVRGVDLSRKHAHSLTLHAAVVCNRDEPRGAWSLHAASAIAAEGTFLEAAWPWGSWNPESDHWASCEQAVNGGKPGDAALAARHFFIDAFKYLPPFGLEAFASARSTADLEGILDQGHPVVLSVVLFPDSFDAAWRNGGFVRLPKPSSENPKTLHYVLLVGFDRARRHFVFANSWGHGFGAGGFGYLAYDYVEKHAVEGLYVEKMRVAAKP